MPPEPSSDFPVQGDLRAQVGAPSREPPQEIPDRDTLLARVGGDAALLGAMAALFLDECPRHLAGIRQAVASNDATGLESTAHALRGSVSNFTAHRASQSALKLELMGRDGSFTGSEQALGELEAEIEHLRPVLEELK